MYKKTRNFRFISLVLTGLLFVSQLSFAQNSRGQIDDPRLKRKHPDAVRFYYASDNYAPFIEVGLLDESGHNYNDTVYGRADSSYRINALGDKQILYYDYFPPLIENNENNKVCAIYIHGGGYTVGYANQGYESSIEPFRKLGFHVISIEYRRGWYVDGSHGPGNEGELSPEEGARFMQAIEFALSDAQDAWSHMNTDLEQHARGHSRKSPFGGYNPLYVFLGNSAGGSIVSRLTLTHEIPGDRRVLGVIVGFGTHSSEETVVNLDVPTVIQGGLLDGLQPVYNNNIYFDKDGPKAKGIFNLYEEMNSGNARVRLKMSAQKGHGYGAYVNKVGGPDYLEEAISFFKECYAGSSPKNYQEFRFSYPTAVSPAYGGYPKIDDGNDLNPGNIYEQLGTGSGRKAFAVDNKNYADGDRLYVNGYEYGHHPDYGFIKVDSGFRYEPIQTDLENGLKPSDIIKKYGIGIATGIEKKKM